MEFDGVGGLFDPPNGRDNARRWTRRLRSCANYRRTTGASSGASIGDGESSQSCTTLNFDHFRMVSSRPLETWGHHEVVCRLTSAGGDGVRGHAEAQTMKDGYLEVTYRHGKLLAAYLYLPRNPRDRSVRVRQFGRGLAVDYRRDGQPIGIEITAPE